MMNEPGRRFLLKNAMLVANFTSNLIGYGTVQLITGIIQRPLPAPILNLVDTINPVFSSCAFFVGITLMLFYERPLRSYLSICFNAGTPTEAMALKARRRTLNEPFFMIAMNFALWLSAAIVFSSAAWIAGAEFNSIRYLFFLSFHTGLITSITAFFMLEKVLQSVMIPFLFPQGGLSVIPRTIRIRIGTRMTALLLACNIVPLISLVGVLHNMKTTALPTPNMVEQMLASITYNSLIFILAGILITFIVKSNLTRPLQSIVEVLSAVRMGNFDRQVRVTSNDEMGYAGDVINQMTVGLKERDLVKEMFGRYMAPEVRDEILAGRIPLDGELKNVTMLFCDLRDFTPMTEALPPREVIKIINRYFEEMESVIHAHHGLVLQFVGDEIEAVFGAPIPRQNHAQLAINAALEMTHKMAQVNEDLHKRGFEPLRHGIGVHSGDVVAANIGSPNRLSYAMVGDTVILASRLQGLNKIHGTEVIVSAATCALVDGPFSFKKLPPTEIKGISRAIDIFTIEGRPEKLL